MDVTFQVNQSDGQAGKVGDVVVEQLGRFVHAIVVATVADALNVSMVGAGNKLFQISQTIGPGVGVDELRLDERLARLLASHLQVADQVLPAAGAVRGGHHIQVGRRIVSLDERVDGLFDQTLLQLGFGQLRPDGGLVASLSKFVSSVQIVHVLNKYLKKKSRKLNLIR